MTQFASFFLTTKHAFSTPLPAGEDENQYEFMSIRFSGEGIYCKNEFVMNFLLQ